MCHVPINQKTWVPSLVPQVFVTVSRSDIGSRQTSSHLSLLSPYLFHRPWGIRWSFISAPSTLIISISLQCPLPLSFSPSQLWVFWASALVSLVLCTQCLAVFFFLFFFNLPNPVKPGIDPKYQTWVSCNAGRFFTNQTTRGAPVPSLALGIYWCSIGMGWTCQWVQEKRR